MRSNRAAKKVRQTRKDVFLSQGAYFAYVTKKKGGLTKYHTPYLRRPRIRKGKSRRKKRTTFHPHPRDFSLNSSAAKSHFASVTSKMRRAHFPNEQAPRANEGGKSEFLRVRRARDLDTLPQKERKPRLKKTILRRNRVPPQRAMVRPVR